MKILQVIPVFSDLFGGPVTVVKSISQELAKKHDVTVYTTAALDTKHDGSYREEEVDGYRIIYFERSLRKLSHAGLFGQLNISSGMSKAIKENLSDFDVVHLHSWQQFPDILVDHYASKYGVPYILQAHGSIPKIGKKFRKFFYDALFGNKILRNSSKFIALSSTEVSQYQSIGISSDRIETVPNGIDVAKYTAPPPKGSFKRKFGLAEEDKVILYIGRIHETKGICLLVKAYSHLIKILKCKKVFLILIGPDDGHLATVKSLITSLGLSNYVMICGFVSSEEKLAAFSDADVFVTPCFYGFPVTFLEACITGTPIITTRMGDNLDWINNKAGYVTDPTEVDLAKSMCSIIGDNALRQKLSQNCRSLVTAEFSIQKVAEKLERVYNAVTVA